MSAQEISDIRPSPIAGRWYPGDPTSLRKSIENYISLVPPIDLPGEILGLIVPHAGYMYSGAIAAHAFRHVMGRSFYRIVVLSPFHAPYPGEVLTTSHQAYQTPLGIIPVDHKVLSLINQYIPLVGVRNDAEHSLEIELPFLQVCLDEGFSLVPLMLRAQDTITSRRLGEVLAQVIKAEASDTLLVASTDLSHFYPAHQAEIYDKTMLGHIAAFDPEGLIRAENMNEGFACGRAAVESMLFASRLLGGNKVEVLRWGHSGEVTGDDSSVVGYGAALVLR